MRSPLVLILFINFLAGAASIFSAQHTPNQEQRVFAAEGESFKLPFTLPKSILDLLSRYEMVTDSLEEKNIPPEQLPGSWFLASEVHLAGPKENDVVVMGQCPVCGANVAPFWLFRPSNRGYELLMFGRGLALRIIDHRTNGYLDIETSMVMTQKPWTGIWRFDGKKYQLVPDKKRRANTSQ
jgi:hypothetical protein